MSINILAARQFVEAFQARNPQYVPRGQRQPTVEQRLDALESPQKAEGHVEKAGHPPVAHRPLQDA